LNRGRRPPIPLRSPPREGPGSCLDGSASPPRPSSACSPRRRSRRGRRGRPGAAAEFGAPWQAFDALLRRHGYDPRDLADVVAAFRAEVAEAVAQQQGIDLRRFTLTPAGFQAR